MLIEQPADSFLFSKRGVVNASKFESCQIFDCCFFKLRRVVFHPLLRRRMVHPVAVVLREPGAFDEAMQGQLAQGIAVGPLEEAFISVSS